VSCASCASCSSSASSEFSKHALLGKCMTKKICASCASCAIELCMPGVNTMQGLNAYCAAPGPYPSFEGETQKNAKRAKEEVVLIKGREFSLDLKIDTIDNPTLARIIVSHQKPLEIKEVEMVEPIGVRRNKNKTYVVCRYVAPTQKARQQMLASIEMEDAPKGQLRAQCA
jgi:hypothetical protein